MKSKYIIKYEKYENKVWWRHVNMCIWYEHELG